MSSYYGIFSDACHLDLVPYATSMKMGRAEQFAAIRAARMRGRCAGFLLRNSSVEMLILNGKSVIEQLQVITGGVFFAQTCAGLDIAPARNQRC